MGSSIGSFYCELYIGRVGGGTYDTYVTIGSSESNKVLFTVTPNITLDHSSGNPGDNIMVNGTGFAANTNLTVKLAGNDWFTVNTGMNGLFDYHWETVPPSIADGTYSVTAGDAPPVSFSVPREKWPVTITEDLTLTEDMVFNDSGLIIGADNITVDLNGYTIKGRYLPNPPIGPTSFGISSSGHSNLTIKNGTIEGFTYGLYFEDSNGNTIQNIILNRNADAGLYAYNFNGNVINQVTAQNGGNIGLGGDGIALANSSNNTLGNITSKDNKLTGFQIMEFFDIHSTNNILKRSVIIGNEEWGVLLTQVSNNTIIDNVINGNTFGAFRLLPIPPSGLGLINAHNNIIRGNTINENRNVGVSVNFSTNNEIKNNQIQSNIGPGMALNVSSNNQFVNNRVHYNTGVGLVVGGPLPSNISEDNLFSSNKLTDNGGLFSIRDVTTGFGTGGTANTYKGNIGEFSYPFDIIISPPGLTLTEEGTIVQTDQTIYFLGESVNITGDGFTPGPINITIVYPGGDTVSVPSVRVDSESRFEFLYSPAPFLPLLDYVPGIVPGCYWIVAYDGQHLARTKYNVISEPPKNEQVGRIILIVQSNPDGAADEFGFKMDYGPILGFPAGLQMPDGTVLDSGYVIPSGISTINEYSIPAGWQVSNIAINDKSGGSYSNGSTTTIDLADGETVIVTYTNTHN